MQMRESIKKGALYVLIPLSALTAGYAGGRVHQYVKDANAIIRVKDPTDDFQNHNFSDGSIRGIVLSSKAIADKSPLVHGLVDAVEGAVVEEPNLRTVPSYNQMFQTLQKYPIPKESAPSIDQVLDTALPKASKNKLSH